MPQNICLISVLSTRLAVGKKAIGGACGASRKRNLVHPMSHMYYREGQRPKPMFFAELIVARKGRIKLRAARRAVRLRLRASRGVAHAPRLSEDGARANCRATPHPMQRQPVAAQCDSLRRDRAIRFRA